MRPPAISVGLLSAAFIAAALAQAPAQAGAPDSERITPRAGNVLTLSWSPSSLAAGALKVSAGAGLAPFAGSEELVITATAPDRVRIQIIDGDHTLVGTSNCVVGVAGGDPTKDLSCGWSVVPPSPRVIVDFAAASVATTTAVGASTTPAVLEFTGGSGPDYVQGGAAADTMFGGGGDDDLFGGAGADRISGDADNDSIDGEEGPDSLGGGPGNDDLTGGEDPDSIIGGPGVDILDSEDGIKDTYVNCDNAPDLGAIIFDRGLDWPYDCPVTLPPSPPRDISVDPGNSSFTANWKPSEFDGNDPLMAYELRWRVPGGSDQPTVVIPGTETSYSPRASVDPGNYQLSMRAVGAFGESAWTPWVWFTVGARPDAPATIQSIFLEKWNATVAWLPVSGSDVTYQLALRVKDRNHSNWLAWTTLPTVYNNTAAVQVGDDLRLFNGRVYQFRVRAVIGKSASNWTVSAPRFAGDFKPLTGASLTRTGEGMLATLTIPGLAWRYNTDGEEGLLAAQYGPKGARSAYLPLNPRTPESVLRVLPGSPEKGFRDCWVGIVYQMPGTSTTSVARVSITCPK